MKKALIVTRISGFVPQFEMSHVDILKEMGYEIHYAANYNTVVYGKDNSRLDGTGIIRHQIDFERSPFSPSVIKACRQLCELLEKEQFDLIHCHMPMSGVVTRICAQWMMSRGKCKKAPVLYTAHGLHFYTGAPLKNWIYYPVERFLARYTDKLIVMNQEDYERSLKFPVRGAVEKIAGAGIDLSGKGFVVAPEKEVAEAEAKAEKRKEIRSKLGIKDEQFVLISVGEITKRKNHQAAIQAVKECNDRDVLYIICGSGPLEQELKENAKSDQIYFAGYQQNIRDYLAAADCFIFPSLQEGLPMALMEAMAEGLPVIALPIRGNTDLITHKKGGYLVPVGKFPQAIMKMKESEERRQAFGQWNKNAIKKFDRSIVDGQMKKIYEQCENNS